MWDLSVQLWILLDTSDIIETIFYCDNQYVVTFLQVTAINKSYRRWGITRTRFPLLHSETGPCWHLNHMDIVVPSGLISVMMYHQYQRQGLWCKCRQLKQSSIQYIQLSLLQVENKNYWFERQEQVITNNQSNHASMNVQTSMQF